MFEDPTHQVVSFSDSDSSNIAKTAYTGPVITGKVKNGVFIKDELQNFNSEFWKMGSNPITVERFSRSADNNMSKIVYIAHKLGIDYIGNKSVSKAHSNEFITIEEIESAYSILQKVKDGNYNPTNNEIDELDAFKSKLGRGNSESNKTQMINNMKKEVIAIALQLRSFLRLPLIVAAEKMNQFANNPARFEKAQSLATESRRLIGNAIFSLNGLYKFNVTNELTKIGIKISSVDFYDSENGNYKFDINERTLPGFKKKVLDVLYDNNKISADKYDYLNNQSDPDQFMLDFSTLPGLMKDAFDVIKGIIHKNSLDFKINGIKAIMSPEVFIQSYSKKYNKNNTKSDTNLQVHAVDPLNNNITATEIKIGWRDEFSYLLDMSNEKDGLSFLVRAAELIKNKQPIDGVVYSKYNKNTIKTEAIRLLSKSLRNYDVLYNDGTEYNYSSDLIGIGLRIPLANGNFISHTRIVGFEVSSGEIIIVPDEIYVKLGADNDIDAFFLSLKMPDVPSFSEATSFELEFSKLKEEEKTLLSGINQLKNGEVINSLNDNTDLTKDLFQFADIQEKDGVFTRFINNQAVELTISYGDSLEESSVTEDDGNSIRTYDNLLEYLLLISSVPGKKKLNNSGKTQLTNTFNELFNQSLQEESERTVSTEKNKLKSLRHKINNLSYGFSNAFIDNMYNLFSLEHMYPVIMNTDDVSSLLSDISMKLATTSDEDFFNKSDQDILNDINLYTKYQEAYDDVDEKNKMSPIDSMSLRTDTKFNLTNMIRLILGPTVSSGKALVNFVNSNIEVFNNFNYKKTKLEVKYLYNDNSQPSKFNLVTKSEIGDSVFDMSSMQVSIALDAYKKINSLLLLGVQMYKIRPYIFLLHTGHDIRNILSFITNPGFTSFEKLLDNSQIINPTGGFTTYKHFAAYTLYKLNSGNSDFESYGNAYFLDSKGVYSENVMFANTIYERANTYLNNDPLVISELLEFNNLYEKYSKYQVVKSTNTKGLYNFGDNFIFTQPSEVSDVDFARFKLLYTKVLYYNLSTFAYGDMLTNLYKIQDEEGLDSSSFGEVIKSNGIYSKIKTYNNNTLMMETDDLPRSDKAIKALLRENKDSTYGIYNYTEMSKIVIQSWWKYLNADLAKLVDINNPENVLSKLFKKLYTNTPEDGDRIINSTFNYFYSSYINSRPMENGNFIENMLPIISPNFAKFQISRVDENDKSRINELEKELNDLNYIILNNLEPDERFDVDDLDQKIAELEDELSSLKLQKLYSYNDTIDWEYRQLMNKFPELKDYFQLFKGLVIDQMDVNFNNPYQFNPNDMSAINSPGDNSSVRNEILSQIKVLFRPRFEFTNVDYQKDYNELNLLQRELESLYNGDLNNKDYDILNSLKIRLKNSNKTLSDQLINQKANEELINMKNSVASFASKLIDTIILYNGFYNPIDNPMIDIVPSSIQASIFEGVKNFKFNNFNSDYIANEILMYYNTAINQDILQVQGAYTINDYGYNEYLKPAELLDMKKQGGNYKDVVESRGYIYDENNTIIFKSKKYETISKRPIGLTFSGLNSDSLKNIEKVVENKNLSC